MEKLKKKIDAHINPKTETYSQLLILAAPIAVTDF